MALLSTIKRAANVVPRWPFTVNRQSDQARGLVAWYPGVNQSSLDVNTGHFNGVHQGSLPFAGATLDGQQAMYFANAIWENLPTDLDVTGEITLATWVQFDSGGLGGTFPTFIAKRANAGAVATNYALRLGSVSAGDKTLCFYFTDAGVAFQVYASTTSVDAYSNVAELYPFHVAVSYKVGTDPHLFINGNLVGASWRVGSAVSLNTNATNASLGALADGAEYMSGKLRDVRIYDRALSDSEVGALYDPATRYELYQPIHSRLYFLPALNNTRVSDFNIALGAV